MKGQNNKALFKSSNQAINYMLVSFFPELLVEMSVVIFLLKGMLWKYISTKTDPDTNSNPYLLHLLCVWLASYWVRLPSPQSPAVRDSPTAQAAAVGCQLGSQQLDMATSGAPSDLGFQLCHISLHPRCALSLLKGGYPWTAALSRIPIKPAGIHTSLG